MCSLKSGILLRDRAYVPDHDSHDQMLKELGIQDDYLGASEKFVRFELSPRDDNLLTDVSTWTMKVDQDIIPAWFDADREKYDGIIVDAVRGWAEKHILREGKHEKKEGIYYLFNDAEITLMDNAQATLRGNARATLRGNAQATLLGNAQATLRGNALATLWDNAQATLRGNARATLWDNAQATLFGNAQATLWGNAQATLWDNAQAELWDNAQATLRDNAQATLRDNAQATLWDNAQAMLMGNAIIGNCKIFENAIVISHKDSKVYVSKKWDMEVIS